MDRLALAEKIIAQTLRRLPSAIRGVAGEIPVTLMDKPTPDLLEPDLEPDLLGLFVGESYDALGATDFPLPAQIFLFLDNILDYVEGDEDAFRDEVRRTYLHELGHYFGWDEDDLAERHLD